MRDEIPVAFQVDGVAERLIDGGQFAAGEGPVEGVARAFAFHGGDVFRPVVGGRKPAQGGVGELAVHLDGRFPLERVALRAAGRAGVAEQSAEHVGDEVAQQLRFLHRFGLFRAEQLGPVGELDPRRRGRRRHSEGGQLGPKASGRNSGFAAARHERGTPMEGDKSLGRRRMAW